MKGEHPVERRVPASETTKKQIEELFFGMNDKAVRKIIYTTNAIESLRSRVRKAVRGRGHFPGDFQIQLRNHRLQPLLLLRLREQ